jgi:hypothetical protein
MSVRVRCRAGIEERELMTDGKDWTNVVREKIEPGVTLKMYLRCKNDGLLVSCWKMRK